MVCDIWQNFPHLVQSLPRSVEFGTPPFGDSREAEANKISWLVSPSGGFSIIFRHCTVFGTFVLFSNVPEPLHSLVLGDCLAQSHIITVCLSWSRPTSKHYINRQWTSRPNISWWGVNWVLSCTLKRKANISIGSSLSQVSSVTLFIRTVSSIRKVQLNLSTGTLNSDGRVLSCMVFSISRRWQTSAKRRDLPWSELLTSGAPNL